MGTLRLFIRLSRPLFLVGVAIVYALGVGIAHYLGVTIDWRLYVLGQAWVSILQLSTQYLNEYYNAPADNENPNRTFLTGGSGAIGTDKLPRRVALMSAMGCLAILASLTVLLIASDIAPSALFIMGIAFLAAFFYSTPPVKLEASGYGELTTSILVAFLVPAYAYILQANEFSPIISMVAFPLTALHLAMLLAFELPDYSTDIKFLKRTIMVRMGWEKGMILHNILVLSAFLLLGLAARFGLPMFVFLPSILLLPLGLLQIWQMRRIADGGKPNWNALTLGALALFGAMAYLMTFTFWIN